MCIYPKNILDENAFERMQSFSEFMSIAEDLVYECLYVCASWNVNVLV